MGSRLFTNGILRQSRVLRPSNPSVSAPGQSCACTAFWRPLLKKEWIMKLKINFKDFDFKQFMLRYGEWVGLGVAGIIALPVLFSGLTKAVGSGSPTAN